MVRFNTIKYKYIKEIYFCVNFLVQKFVLSIIIRIFAAREPAKPLNDAQMCGSFFKAVTAPFQACFVELRFYFCSDILLIIRKMLAF